MSAPLPPTPPVALVAAEAQAPPGLARGARDGELLDERVAPDLAQPVADRGGPEGQGAVPGVVELAHGDADDHLAALGDMDGLFAPAAA